MKSNNIRKPQKNNQWRFNTKVIHGGPAGVHPEGAHNLPIFQSSNFVFKNLEEGAARFRDETSGYSYTRIDNPNFRELEAKIAELESGKDCLVFASGMAAVREPIEYLAGKEKTSVICTRTLYVATDSLFSDIMPRTGKDGLEFLFTETRDPENVRKAIDGVVKRGVKNIIIFLETPANPTLDLADIKEISKIAEPYKTPKRKVSLIVDNSFATPYNQRPIELGADYVIQSLTKALNGHGDLIMGAVIGKDSLRTGEGSFFHWRVVTGAVPSPHDCALVVRGLKTFALRMERHNYNAVRLAEFLENAGCRVFYPGLKSNPQYELALRQMRTPNGEPGFGGMISFELKGGLGAAKKFLERLPKKGTSDDGFISLAVSLGYIETLIQSPALMTHASIPREKRLAKGITDGLIRLSVGIEDYDDLEDAFRRALKRFV